MLAILLLTALTIAATLGLAHFLIGGGPDRRMSLRDRWRRLRLDAAIFGPVGALYFRRGKSNAWLLPAISGAAGPTLAEITAGTELGGVIAGISGFETTLNRVQQPTLKYAQDFQVDGPQQFGDAQMIILDDDGVGSDAESVERQTASTVLQEQTTGYIVLSPRKTTPIAGTKVHVFPQKIGARNDAFTLDTEVARYRVDYAITGAARKDVLVLA